MVALLVTAECGNRLHVHVQKKAGSVNSGLHTVDAEGDEGMSGPRCGGKEPAQSSPWVMRSRDSPSQAGPGIGAASGAVSGSGPGEPLCVFCILIWAVVLGVYTLEKTEVLGLNSSCSMYVTTQK